MIERLHINTTEPVYKDLKDGVKVVAHRIETPRPTPSSTAKHEAAHIVAAGEIVEATIIPSGDSLGSARPVRMTAVSAAAAGAMGHGGTGWDRFLTEHYLGVDWGSAMKQAKAVLAGREDEIHEVATTLQEEMTINQHHVNRARERVVNKKQGIFPVKVDIYQAGRKIDSTITRSFHGEVVISQKWNL